MILPFLIYVCDPKIFLIGIGIRQSWLQKYRKTFATYLQIWKNQIINHLVIVKAVHDGSTHAQVNHHEREHQSHQYVERTFHTYFLHLSFLKLQN